MDSLILLLSWGYSSNRTFAEKNESWLAKKESRGNTIGVNAVRHHWTGLPYHLCSPHKQSSHRAQRWDTAGAFRALRTILLGHFPQNCSSKGSREAFSFFIQQPSRRWPFCAFFFNRMQGQTWHEPVEFKECFSFLNWETGLDLLVQLFEFWDRYLWPEVLKVTPQKPLDSVKLLQFGGCFKGIVYTKLLSDIFFPHKWTIVE